MLSLLAFTCPLLVLFMIERYLSLQRNIKVAKEANLPYIIVPLYTATPVWYFCYNLILPVFRKLPKAWTSPWLDFLDPYWSWKLHHEPFARLGSDTIVIVAPGGLIFCTCDPNIVIEVANRRWDFCKPVESYVYLDLFGPSLITREGRTWRAHQRMLAPTFSERNAGLVWDESINQAEQMLKAWLIAQRTGVKYISDIREDTMTLPFHVINKAGFGIDMMWPWKETTSGVVLGGTDQTCAADTVGEGHRMSYREALHSTVSHLFHILVFPDWLLRIAPLRYANLLHIAHKETVTYLKELMTNKENELKDIQKHAGARPGFDIMSALVSAKVEHENPSADTKITQTLEDAEALTERAILSNVFLMLIAGHETTATILLLTFIELAINLDWQQKMQKDLDKIFGNRSHSAWDLQLDAEKLSGGTVGATINEVLRLYPPANIIPKGTRKGSPQIIKNGPQEFVIPENTALQFLAISIHHNPKYWPSEQTSPGKKDDLDVFKPQRWFLESDKSWAQGKRTGDTSRLSHLIAEEEVLGQDTSTSLFRPQPGAYIPFSTGHRGCIGRRFATVEMLAVIAVIFKDYGLELDVEEFADDATVERMTQEQRRMLYEKAAEKTRRVTREGMRHHLTMQLKKGRLALRLVKRGEERFMT